MTPDLILTSGCNSSHALSSMSPILPKLTQLESTPERIKIKKGSFNEENFHSIGKLDLQRLTCAEANDKRAIRISLISLSYVRLFQVCVSLRRAETVMEEP